MAEQLGTDAVVANSRHMIQVGSKSFSAAARLFDEQTRDGAYMLYAWCRYCDDEIDGQHLGFRDQEKSSAGAMQRFERLQELTHRALAGEHTGDPVFEAFRRVVEQHAIPARYPLDLLEGFAMDVRGRTYSGFADTLEYCYHVAGVVGVMMAHVMGAQGEDTLNRACDLGMAFQLTNISRDVIDDAENGRVYLPEQWLREAGVAPDEIAAAHHRDAVFKVVARMLDEAERYYSSAREGLRGLPFRSAWAVATANGVYRDIGRKVMRRGAHAWDDRTSIGSAGKVCRALLGGISAVRAVSVDRLTQPAPRPQLWTRSVPPGS